MPPPHKWNVRKGYLKIHVVTVDIKKKKIVSLEVASEEIHDDGSRLKNLENALENNTLKTVIADVAYIVNRILHTCMIVI
jgi:hypothetical protein